MNRCLIADDHAMLRDALVGSVRLGWPGAEICEAEDFPSAWAAAASGPDLILSDLAMPGAAPLEGIERLIEAAPGTPLLVITGNDDDQLLLALFDLGVAGYLPKSSRSATIEAAIGLILTGERFIPARVLELIAARGAGSAGSAASGPLTARQLDVLRLVAQGLTNKEIARELALSPATVKVHAAAIFETLGAATRTEAVNKAQGLRLLS